MAEIVGQLGQEVGERSVVRSKLVEPMATIDNFLLNNGIRKTGGRVEVDRALIDLLWPPHEEAVRAEGKSRVRLAASGTVEARGANEEYRRIFRQIVKDVVEAGVVSRGLAVAAGYFVRPSSVGEGEMKAAGAYFLPVPTAHYRETLEVLGENRQAKKGWVNKRPLPVREKREQVGIRLVASAVRRKADQLQSLGEGRLSLTHTEAEDLAKQVLLVHEYGHGLIRALELREIEARGVGDEKEMAQIRMELRERVTQSWPARDKEGRLVDLPGVSVDERLAIGLERLMLGKWLKDRGIDAAGAAALADEYFGVAYKWIKRDWDMLVAKAGQKGLSIKEMCDVYNTLSMQVKDGQVTRNRLGIYSGYVYPFSEQQLKEILTSSNG